MTEVVERRMWIDAPPSSVFEAFLDPARLAGRPSGNVVGQAGDYRVEIGDGEFVFGRYLHAVPARRLLFTWAVASPAGTSPLTTVEVTLAPQGFGTSVHLVHSIDDQEPAEIGGSMSDAPTLYDRHGPTDGELRCEWCGRPGEALPFHVQSPNGDVEFAEPVLCAVCQGLLGYFHPHGGHPGTVEAQSKSVTRHTAPAPPTREEQEKRLRQAADWSSGVVTRLLTERFMAEGRPRPAWAGPSWVWPPRHFEAPEA